MLKKTLLNLVLFGIVIILIYFVSHTKKENNLLATLTKIKPDTISQIIIQHNKHKSVLIKKYDHGKAIWKFTQPIIIGANSFRIRSLLRLLNAPVQAHYTSSEISLRKIGLKNSPTSIQFNHHLIQFGIINPINHLRYILYNNNVYLIEDVYFPLINSNFSTLVAMELLPHNSDIEKLVLPHLTIDKNSRGLWQSNVDLPADTIIRTVQQWKTFQAFGVHQYMQRASLGKIQVYLKSEKKPITFQISDIRPWVILARPELNLEYHLDIKANNLLINPAQPTPASSPGTHN